MLKRICEQHINEGTDMHVVWADLQIYLCQQRGGCGPAGVALWDYHVFAAQRRPGLPSLIWDLDRFAGRCCIDLHTDVSARRLFIQFCNGATFTFWNGIHCFVCFASSGRSQQVLICDANLRIW